MPHNHHVCPWWMGYLLITPFRRFMQDPVKILSPFMKPGMTVLEIGPGMDISRSRSPGWSDPKAGS